jgi:hypothetical protein
MGEEQLLQLAQQFLFSDAGKKLVGDTIDLDLLKKQITSEIQSRTLELQSDTGEEDLSKKSSQTREERKAARQDERTQNREEREKRQEERRKEREKRAEERRQRGGTVGQFIPEFGIYTTSGRVFDQFTKNPLEGVKVQIAIKDPITGGVIPISGERVEEEEGNVTKRDVYTINDGSFIISYRLPYLPYNNKLLVEAYILYTKESYLPLPQSLLTGEREVKTDLPAFSLVDLNQAANDALPEYLGEYYPIYKTTREALLAPKEKVLVFRKQQILKSIETIQTRLLPLAIGLLLTFGITKLSEKNQKICPSASALNANVERRNRVVRQLNQIFKQITLNTAIAAALTAIAALLKSNKSIILNLPLPLGAPIGVGVPYSAVAKLQEVEQVLTELESDNTELNKQIVNGLILLTAAITTILVLLKLLDEMTQECAVELNVQPEAISQELIELSNEATEEGVTSPNSVNGFTLEVQAIDQDSVGKLKRRQAIGKNSQGIVIIKGEPSFSSSDQILINELAFYIQSNNLKAF